MKCLECEAASSAHFLPMTGMISGSCFTRMDRPKPAPGLAPDANFLVVSPGYFSVMGIPLLSGRDFDARDVFGRNPVMLINEALATQFFPGEDPIGKRVDVCWSHSDGHDCRGGRKCAAREAFGKSGGDDLSGSSAGADFSLQTWSSVRRCRPRPSRNRSSARSIAWIPIRRFIRSRAWNRWYRTQWRGPGSNPGCSAVFAGVALLLAAVGLYGVLAYSVTQRRQEIGIRVALGAEPAQLIQHVIGDALRLVLPGVALGVLGSFAMTRLLRSLLYEIKPGDPWTVAAVSIGLMVVALVAAYVPARRAAGMDPLSALRYE